MQLMSNFGRPVNSCDKQSVGHAESNRGGHGVRRRKGGRGQRAERGAGLLVSVACSLYM